MCLLHVLLDIRLSRAGVGAIGPIAFDLLSIWVMPVMPMAVAILLGRESLNVELALDFRAFMGPLMRLQVFPAQVSR